MLANIPRKEMGVSDRGQLPVMAWDLSGGGKWRDGGGGLDLPVIQL